tara:strand:- start:89 stop:1075 length:987 start_codon:yes stop_codon:yes gene_type:complete
MSSILVDQISARLSGAAVTVTGQCDVGVAVTMDGTAGVITATSFSGDGSSLRGVVGTSVTAYIDAASVTSSGIVTITNTTTSTSVSTGALIVSGGVGIAKSLFVGENVSIGGTLTYEDVTNIDSVGVVTARLGVIATAGRGIQVTAGGLNVDAGIGTFDAGVTVGGGDFKVGTAITSGGTTGIATFAAITHFDQGIFLNANNPSREKIYTASTALSGEFDLTLENGNVWYLTGNAGATFTPDIKVNGSVSLNSAMSNNEAIVVTLIHATNNTSYYANAFKIDNTSVTPEYLGGAPSASGSDGFDCYTWTIIKTGNNAFKVFGNLSNFT